MKSNKFTCQSTGLDETQMTEKIIFGCLNKTFRIVQSWNAVTQSVLFVETKKMMLKQKDDAFYGLNNTTELKLELFVECKKLSIFVGENVRIIQHQCPFALVGRQCPSLVSIFIGRFSSKCPFSLVSFHQNCFSRMSRIVSVHFHWSVFIKTSIFIGPFSSKLFFQDVMESWMCWGTFDEKSKSE